MGTAIRSWITPLPAFRRTIPASRWSTSAGSPPTATASGWRRKSSKGRNPTSISSSRRTSTCWCPPGRWPGWTAGWTPTRNSTPPPTTSPASSQAASRGSSTPCPRRACPPSCSSTRPFWRNRASRSPTTTGLGTTSTASVLRSPTWSSGSLACTAIPGSMPCTPMEPPCSQRTVNPAIWPTGTSTPPSSL